MHVHLEILLKTFFFHKVNNELSKQISKMDH